MTTRSQFWVLVRWANIQAGRTEEEMREAREKIEAYGSALQDLLADGQTQAALDLMRSLGGLQNPPRPTEVEADPIDYQSVELSWSGAGDTFDVYRAAGEDADDWSAFELLAADEAASPYTDAEVVPATEYAYRVVAKVGGAPSVPSGAAVVTVPVVPQVQNVAATSVDAPVVTWDAVSPAPTTYAVYRDGAELEADASTPHTDDTAEPDTTYTYTVSATYSGVEGAQSDGADATTPAAP